MRIKLTNLIKKCIYLMMIIMPFHVLIFNYTGTSALALWRDFFVVFIMLLSLKLPRRYLKFDKLYLVMIIRAIACIMFAVLFHDYSMSTSVWVNVLRVYIFPSMILFPLRRLLIEKEFVRKCCKIYVTSAVVISLFGIVQMIVIGRSYLRFMGVGYASVLLADGTQRNIGVFESANVMALFVLYALIILFKIDKLFERIMLKRIMITILVISLILTFSVSVIGISIVLSLFELFVSNKTTISKKDVFKFLGGLAGVFLLLYLAFISNHAFTVFLQSHYAERIHDIVSSISGKNMVSTSSAAIHISDLVSGFDLLLHNLNGLGFAKESFMVYDKVFYKTLIGKKESSILTIMYDFGIAVGVLYLFPLVMCLIPKRDNTDEIKMTRDYILIATLAVYVFLPIIQSYEISFFTFFFLGLFYYYERYNSSFRG